MFYADSDVETAAKLLLPKERGLSISHMVRQSRILPKYWLHPSSNTSFMYQFGRQLLREWAKESPKAFDLMMPDKSMSVWDFLFSFAPGPRPWFVDNPWWIKNQQGRLLRMDWEGYKNLWPYYQPPKGFPPLIPGINKDTWIIDGTPMNCDPEFLNRMGYFPKHFKAAS